MKNSLKFVFFLVYLLAIFWIEDLKLLIMLFGSHFLLMMVWKIGIRRFVQHLKIGLPFVLFTAGLNSILSDLRSGILMGVRLMMAYQITYIFSNKMTNATIASSIQSLFKPFKIFGICPENIGLTIEIALCVLPILKSEVEQKKYAMKAKGVQVTFRSGFIFMKPLFLSILRRTNEMEKSLRAKGYEE